MLSKQLLRAQPSSPFSPRALLSRLLFFQEIFPLGGRANPCIFQLQIFRNRIRSILSLFSPLSSSANSSCYAICSGTDHSLSNYPTLLQFGSRLPTKNGPILSTSGLTLYMFRVYHSTHSKKRRYSQTRRRRLQNCIDLLDCFLTKNFLLTISHLFQTKIKVERQKI